jgi:hypothetical protein
VLRIGHNVMMQQQKARLFRHFDAPTAYGLMVPMMIAALAFAIVCVREPSVSAEMVETRRVGHFPHVGGPLMRTSFGSVATFLFDATTSAGPRSRVFHTAP